ncbi:MAG: hypothetical protein PHE68_00745 [Candidatus Peribacteraceae bacterium]|nr:hypothetical protein [Candidatus Peribacteraceae bacterium]
MESPIAKTLRLPVTLLNYSFCTTRIFKPHYPILEPPFLILKNSAGKSEVRLLNAMDNECLPPEIDVNQFNQYEIMVPGHCPKDYLSDLERLGKKTPIPLIINGEIKLQHAPQTYFIIALSIAIFWMGFMQLLRKTLFPT